MSSVLVTSVKDVVAEEFGPVGFSNNVESARRQFRFQMDRMVESPSIRADYELYCVGVFDTVSGSMIIDSDMPKLLDCGSNYLPKSVAD